MKIYICARPFLSNMSYISLPSLFFASGRLVTGSVKLSVVVKLIHCGLILQVSLLRLPLKYSE